MAIKMGGYTCDKCDVVIVEPDNDEMLYRAIHAMQNLLRNINLIFRIYCPTCGKIKEQVEWTMKLKDVRDIKDIPHK